MKKLGIHSVIRKRRKNIFMPSRMKRQKNILQRDFYATVPNQKMGYRCNGIQSTPREKETVFKCHYRIYMTDIPEHML